MRVRRIGVSVSTSRLSPWVFRLTCGPLPRGRGGLRLGRALKDTSGMGRPEEVRLVMGTTRKGFVGPLVGRIAIKSGTSVTVLMWV